VISLVRLGLAGQGWRVEERAGVRGWIAMHLRDRWWLREDGLVGSGFVGVAADGSGAGADLGDAGPHP